MLRELDALDAALKFVNCETEEQTATADNLFRAIEEARRVFGLEFEGEDTVPERFSYGCLQGARAHICETMQLGYEVPVTTLVDEFMEALCIEKRDALNLLLRMVTEDYLLPTIVGSDRVVKMRRVA